MKNILVIEDESLAAGWLKNQIETLAPDFKVMQIIDSVESAVLFLQQNNPDLIFCDIHLADGISFSIFEQVKINIPVIFTTAFDQYAIKAFQVNSIDYLLKPIETAALQQAIQKYRLRVQPAGDLTALLQSLSAQAKYQERFLVQAGQKLKSIPTTSIAYFFAENKLNFLCDSDGKTFMVDQSLDKLEPQLDPDTFFRINRQFIVSYGAIKEMHQYSKSRVKIILTPPASQETIVSAERSAAFKAWLNR